MGRAFINFLKSFNQQKVIKTFDHASKLYVNNTYLRSPKVGFIYFIAFNINKNTLVEGKWKEKKYFDEVGLLVKKMDLPKFQIATETLNQYNRKTVVQTKLNYSPVTVEFHDDNHDIVNGLWIAYYRYHYADTAYGGAILGKSERNEKPPEFRDTKYIDGGYTYGRQNEQFRAGQFFDSIDVYILHQQKFTQITLINPKITEWAHDSLEQDQGGKILRNRMTFGYENVLYNQGKITESQPEGYNIFYDNEHSPYSSYENPLSKAIRRLSTGENVDGGVADVFGEEPMSFDWPAEPDISSIVNNYDVSKNDLEYELDGPLDLSQSLFAESGDFDNFLSDSQDDLFDAPGGAGITVFKGFNSGNDDITPANPIDTGDYGGGI